MPCFVLLSLLVPVLTLVSVGEALAHGSGLDAYGCHHNRKLGGYHSHRGPLAGRAFTSKDEMLRTLKETTTTRPAPPAPSASTKGQGAGHVW